MEKIKLKKFIKSCQYLNIPNRITVKCLLKQAMNDKTKARLFMAANEVEKNKLLSSLAATGAVLGGTVGYQLGDSLFSEMPSFSAKLLGAGVGGLLGSLAGNVTGSMISYA